MTPNVLINFIAHQAKEHKPETLKQYVSALRSKHVDSGYSTKAFEDERLSRLYKGVPRTHGIKPSRERNEITKEKLLAMLKRLDVSRHDDANLYAAFCVAFAGFLRPGEFTWDKWDPITSPNEHATRQSIQFTPQGVLFLLPRSKTSIEPVSIPLASADDASCPVRALNTLFHLFPRPLNNPLFSRTLGAFNQSWLNQNIRKTLFEAGFNPTGYSGHCFRRGVANTALDMGLNIDEIKSLGRWNSDAYGKYQNKQSKEKIKFAVNKQLHLAALNRRTPFLLLRSTLVPREPSL